MKKLLLTFDVSEYIFDNMVPYLVKLLKDEQTLTVYCAGTFEDLLKLQTNGPNCIGFGKHPKKNQVISLDVSDYVINNLVCYFINLVKCQELEAKNYAEQKEAG